jgi:hypothetical protein
MRDERDIYAPPRKGGFVIAYRVRIAYFDVISRKGSPKVAHISWISSVSGDPIARASLKATTSAMTAT